MKVLIFIGFFLINDVVKSKEVDLKHLKCLVCRATMKELETEVFKADPQKLIEIGSYKMDAQGNTINKKIPLGQSEVHISDILDNICQKMTDYVRGTKKSNNQLTIFNILSASGGMNPLMSEVDIIQDGDLNKSLEHYCSGIIEEFEDDIVSLYINNMENKKEKLCTEISNICNKNYVEDDEDNGDDNNTNNLNLIEEFIKGKEEL